jgi:pimeloyl-ACP methyl ester carboxylesterase
MVRRRYLYLHGFASSRESAKGLRLRDLLADAGIELELLELNVPDFESMTYSSILEHLDRVDAARPARALALVGSSMGGYLAARWAELNPERVERLFLLCPGFDLASRWPRMLGSEAFAAWERDGALEVEDGSGRKRMLSWQFVLDSRRHPAWPEVRCPTRIVHGIHDDTVPLTFSRRYAATREHVALIELDDDHRLLSSVDRIAAELRAFLE